MTDILSQEQVEWFAREMGWRYQDDCNGRRLPGWFTPDLLWLGPLYDQHDPRYTVNRFGAVHSDEPTIYWFSSHEEAVLHAAAKYHEQQHE